MKCVTEDPSYITGGELEYPQELFLRVEILKRTKVILPLIFGQMTYLVASLTLDSANSCMMQGASCTQRKISMVLFSTPFVLSWGGSISSDSFLPSILLLVVIIVMVVIVVVSLIVVVILIVGMVIVVVIIRVVVIVGDVSSILKLSFVIIGDLIGLFYSDSLGICIPPRQGIISQGVSLGSVFQLGLLVSAMVAACASQAAAIPSTIRVSASLGGEISSGGRKSWESNSDNTGGIIVDEAIRTCSGGICNSLVASYVCMTSIYGSSCKGEKTSVAKRYLVKSFEESREVFLDVAGKYSRKLKKKASSISKVGWTSWDFLDQTLDAIVEFRKKLRCYKVTIKGYDDEFARLKLAKKYWLVLVVPRFKRETKRRVMEELVCLVTFKIGVKASTSASGSQPSGNTKKDKIQLPPSSAQMNKVEARPKTVKSCLNNKICAVKHKGIAVVHHSKLNANFELICVKTTTTTEVPLRKPTALEIDAPKPEVTLVYSRKPKKSKTNVPVSKPKNIKSISANKKEPSKSWGSIVSDVPSSSLDEYRLAKLFFGTVKFRNDHVEKIMAMSKASKTNSWLWHRRLSPLNFGTINHLARHGLVRGIPKIKFEKDNQCSACAMGKSKKKPYKLESEDTNQEKHYLLHMDLCGPMRVASFNGKKYILVIVDDYSRSTWVKFLRSKYKAP
nr:retrovirus-related Pol polyprotein from transposon TNT 1-94 [Tanacetum cinerariifolium]